jgi:hypothetical protein
MILVTRYQQDGMFISAREISCGRNLSAIVDEIHVAYRQARVGRDETIQVI